MFFPKAALSGFNTLATAKTLLAPCAVSNGGGGSAGDPDLSTPTNEGIERTWKGSTTGTVYREADNPLFMFLDRNPTGKKTRYTKTWDELGPKGKQKRVNDYDKAVADGDLPAPSAPNATPAGAAAAAGTSTATCTPPTDTNLLLQELVTANRISNEILDTQRKRQKETEGNVNELTGAVSRLNDNVRDVGKELEKNFAVTTKNLTDAHDKIASLQQQQNDMEDRQVKVEALVQTNAGDILLNKTSIKRLDELVQSIITKKGGDASFPFESTPNDEGATAHTDASAGESVQDDSSSPLGLDAQDDSLALLNGGAANGQAAEGANSYQTSILSDKTVMLGQQPTTLRLFRYDTGINEVLDIAKAKNLTAYMVSIPCDIAAIYHLAEAEKERYETSNPSNHFLPSLAFVLCEVHPTVDGVITVMNDNGEEEKEFKSFELLGIDWVLARTDERTGVDVYVLEYVSSGILDDYNNRIKLTLPIECPCNVRERIEGRQGATYVTYNGDVLPFRPASQTKSMDEQLDEYIRDNDLKEEDKELVRQYALCAYELEKGRAEMSHVDRMHSLDTLCRTQKCTHNLKSDKDAETKLDKMELYKVYPDNFPYKEVGLDKNALCGGIERIKADGFFPNDTEVANPADLFQFAQGHGCDADGNLIGQKKEAK